MPTVEIKRDAEILLRVTPEQHEAVRRAAALETDGDVTGFIANAVVKAAKTSLTTHESCRRILHIGGK